MSSGTIRLTTSTGIAKPMPALEPDGDTMAGTRAAAKEFGPREKEVELLLRRWARAESGEGQVVLLSGEPGISSLPMTVNSIRENPVMFRRRGSPRRKCCPHVILRRQSNNPACVSRACQRRAAGRSMFPSKRAAIPAVAAGGTS